jgi:hypothetical protein
MKQKKKTSLTMQIFGTHCKILQEQRSVQVKKKQPTFQKVLTPLSERN